MHMHMHMHMCYCAYPRPIWEIVKKSILLSSAQQGQVAALLEETWSAKFGRDTMKEKTNTSRDTALGPHQVAPQPARRSYDCGPIDGSMGTLTATACQKWMFDEGENPGPIDGKFGNMTAKAFQSFLKKQAPQSKYDPGPIDGKFRDGKRSTRAFQQWLADQDYNPGPIDGVWGSQTVSALQRFLKND